MKIKIHEWVVYFGLWALVSALAVFRCNLTMKTCFKERLTTTDLTKKTNQSGVLRILSDGDYRMGAKIKTPKIARVSNKTPKIPGPKIAPPPTPPKKTHAEFLRLLHWILTTLETIKNRLSHKLLGNFSATFAIFGNFQNSWQLFFLAFFKYFLLFRDIY